MTVPPTGGAGARRPHGSARVALCAALAGLHPACTGDPGVDPPLRFELDEHWPERSTYPGVGAGRVIITNNYEDTVSIFDLAELGDPGQTELARVPVGFIPIELEGPHHATIAPSGEHYYVGISNFVENSGSGPHGAHGSGAEDGYALEYRASDNRLTRSVRVDPNPGDLTITPDGSTLFVTHFDQLRVVQGMRENNPEKMNARLAILDAASMTRRAMVPLCPMPHGVVTSADGRTVYAACYTDELAVVDVATSPPSVVRVDVALDGGAGVTDAIYRPYALAVRPVNGEVWISGTEGRKLFVYDPGTGAMDHARALSLPGQPFFGTFSSDGGTFYLTYQSPDGVAIIDTARMAIVEEVRLPPTICRAPHQLVLAPGEQQMLLVCEGDRVGPGTFVVLDVAPGDLTYHHHAEVGVYPDYVGVLRGRE